ncbi:MAG: radical SAM protein [Bacteroidales bacterium]|nr:radical SAM protein [Bacteroidales bacterium]
MNIFKQIIKKNIFCVSEKEEAKIPSWLSDYNKTRQEKQTEFLCHAPYKSMLLSNNGAVLACCFNRQAILGHYPQKTLKEIWFSAEADVLRNKIKNNDLSWGCFVCKNQILNKEFKTVKARMFDHLPQTNQNFPSMMEFDMDNTCNLECVMCNADNSSSIRSRSPLYGPYKNPYDTKILSQLEEFIPHLSQASFAGGEPFLVQQYYDIWEKMMALNPDIKINIITNGTILNDKIKNIIQKGFFDFSISIDSINKETYAKIRKNASLEKVLEHLNYFDTYCKQKNTKLYIWVCPLRLNRFEIHDVFNYFNEKGIEVFLHTVWVPPSVTIWNLPSEELFELSRFYENKKLSTDTLISKNNNSRFREFVSQISQWALMAEMRESNTQNNQGLIPSLKEKLLKKYIEKKYNPDTLTQRKEEFYIKIDFCKSKLPKDIFEHALFLLNTYPDDFIFQIFEAGTKEMIADFFIYLNR